MKTLVEHMRTAMDAVNTLDLDFTSRFTIENKVQLLAELTKCSIMLEEKQNVDKRRKPKKDSNE